MKTALLLIAHGSREEEANADLDDMVEQLCIRNPYACVEAPLFLLALGVGYLAYRTQSLVASIVFHALFNGVVCVGMVLSYAGPADGRDNFCGSPTIFGPCKSTRLQMQREFGQDELVQAHAFGFRFAGQGGVQRFGHAHVKLAAVLAPLGTNLRFR
jgi:hypothetical protein